jgi:N-acetylglutamate synthase/N-acetylornithine aminotransferase
MHKDTGVPQAPHARKKRSQQDTAHSTLCHYASTHRQPTEGAVLAACVHSVLTAGVIGRRMKMDAFVPAIPELIKSLGSSPADAHRAAVAITTTDLVSKEAALEVGHTFVSHIRVTLLSHTFK